ncbi:MAG: hypothetical protein ACI30O_07405, partial [Muribaculaceae bacterium]
TNDPEITNHVLWPTELKRHVNFLSQTYPGRIPFFDRGLLPVCGCKVTTSFLITKNFTLFFSLFSLFFIFDPDTH